MGNSQNKIKSVKTAQLTWYNIVDAGKAEIDFLRKKFKFLEIDLADAQVANHAQRPKIDIRSNYIFLIFLFPFYNQNFRKIEPREIDIFITKGTLITVHNVKNGVINQLFEERQNKPGSKSSWNKKTALSLLYEMLNQLYNGCFPMIDHLSLEISKIEDNIYAKKERQIVEAVLIVKRNIVNFLKIMQPHKRILRKIATTDFPFLTDEKKLAIYYNDLIDHTKNIWDTLENYQQTIDNLEDTNNILVSFKINDIMRTLTIFSVILFPLTLVASIFGMNVSDLPIIGTPYDFWKIMGLMLLATIIMSGYFKYKKWV